LLFGKNEIGATAERPQNPRPGAALSAILSKLAGSERRLRGGRLSSTLGVQILGGRHIRNRVVLSSPCRAAFDLVAGLSPRQKPAGLSVLIGLSLGYGLLAKGPVAVAVPLIGALCAAPFVTSLRQRWAEAIGDAAIAGAVGITIAAPWYGAMTWRHGVAFLENGVWAQNVGRYTGAVDHGQSAITFIAATLVGLMPWTGLLPAALARVRPPKGDRRRAVRFTAAVMAGAS
jgi:hypothetical protein